MFNQCTLKLTRQYLLFVIQKSLGTFTYQQTDDTGTQIGNLFVDITYDLQRLFHMRLTFIVKIRKKQTFRFVCSQYFQFMRILNIHHLITDIVSRLYQVNQWMTSISQRMFIQLYHAQFLSNTTETSLFTDEKTEFRFLSRQTR